MQHAAPKWNATQTKLLKETCAQYPVEALSQRQRFLQEYIVQEKLAVQPPRSWSPNRTLILHVNAVSRSSRAHLLQFICGRSHI